MAAPRVSATVYAASEFMERPDFKSEIKQRIRENAVKIHSDVKPNMIKVRWVSRAPHESDQSSLRVVLRCAFSTDQYYQQVMLKSIADALFAMFQSLDRNRRGAMDGVHWVSIRLKLDATVNPFWDD